jgi:hypothetical protein
MGAMCPTHLIAIGFSTLIFGEEDLSSITVRHCYKMALVRVPYSRTLLMAVHFYKNSPFTSSAFI